MKHKKHLLGVVMLGTMLAVTVLSGCESGKTKKVEKAEKTESALPENLVTIAEARKQAENFESEYKNLDFSEAQIKIPDVQQVYEMEFPVHQRHMLLQIHRIIQTFIQPDIFLKFFHLAVKRIC